MDTRPTIKVRYRPGASGPWASARSILTSLSAETRMPVWWVLTAALEFAWKNRKELYETQGGIGTIISASVVLKQRGRDG